MARAEEPRHAELRRGAERVLRANWREGHRSGDGVPYAFTCPATPRYRHQWYSCRRLNRLKPFFRK